MKTDDRTDGGGRSTDEGKRNMDVKKNRQAEMDKKFVWRVRVACDGTALRGQD